MENKLSENNYKLTPRGYNPKVVGLTLRKFFHILKKIEEEEENNDEEDLSQSV